MATITPSATSSQYANLQTMVQALTTTERSAITALQTKKSGLQAQLKTYQSLATHLSSLMNLAGGFAVPVAAGGISTMTGDVSDPAALAVEVNGMAAPGTHAVKVRQLAQHHTLASRIVDGLEQPALTDGEGSVGSSIIRVAAGDESIDVRFSATAGSTYDEILSSIAQAINDAGGPVTATSMDVGGGSRRLLIQSARSGAGAVITEVSDLQGSWMRDLGLAGDGQTGPAVMQEGMDAVFQVDGVRVASPDNTLRDVIAGVTLTAKAAGTGAQTVEILPDVDAITRQVQGFLTEYNATLTEVRNDTAPADQNGAGRGPLAGNLVFNRLRTALREAALRPVEGSGTRYLNDLGITSSRDGSLALSNPEALKGAIRSHADQVEHLMSGIGARVSDVLKIYSRTGGILSQQQNTTQSQIRLLDGRITRSTADLTRRQDLLMSQLGQLQASVGLLSQQQQYLSGLLSSGDTTQL